MKTVTVLELDDIKPGLRIRRLKDDKIITVVGITSVEPSMFRLVNVENFHMWSLEDKSQFSSEALLIALNTQLTFGDYKIETEERGSIGLRGAL
jgi:hypothetical protein